MQKIYFGGNIITMEGEGAAFNGEYIQGFGYDQNRLKEGVHPNKFLLDKVSLYNPVFITHASMHMGVANSIALDLAGITKESGLAEKLAGRLPNSEPKLFIRILLLYRLIRSIGIRAYD